MIAQKRSKKLVTGAFISVPVLSSLISTIHIISLFNLGNINWMSWILALTFEVGSVTAFLIPTFLKNIRKGMIYSVFSILVFMQIVGNIFYSYDFIFNKLKTTPTWLDSFYSFISNFGYFDPNTINLLISLLIGLPIPIVSLFFLKSLVDYVEAPMESIVNENTFDKKEDIYNIEESDNLDNDEIAVLQNNNLK